MMFEEDTAALTELVDNLTDNYSSNPEEDDMVGDWIETNILTEDDMMRYPYLTMGTAMTAFNVIGIPLAAQYGDSIVESISYGSLWMLASFASGLLTQGLIDGYHALESRFDSSELGQSIMNLYNRIGGEE